MRIFLLLFIPMCLHAQSSMDELRWYLKPQGQQLTISIDDLHDEIIQVSPQMDWGFQSLQILIKNKEVQVAVIDGGVEIEHPELKDVIAYNSTECFDGNIIPSMKDDLDGNGFKGDCAGWNFVEDNNRAEDLDGHGTHVAGIINTVANYAQGMPVKILPLRVFAPDEGRRSVKASPLPVRLVKAFEYALARKVDIIHMSVGWPKSFMSYELEQIINKALSQGVIIVSAAGNSSQRATIFPCQMKGVICVGALRPDATLARFSNWGSQVDVLVPGEKILSTIPQTIAPLHISRRGYDYKNGTSQAAPFVTGALAVMKAVLPQTTSEELIARLYSSSSAGVNGKSMRGLFNIPRALSMTPAPLIIPQFKGLHSAVVSDAGLIEVKFNFKNIWIDKDTVSQVKLLCSELNLDQEVFELPPLSMNSETTISLRGELISNAQEINCQINLEGENYSLKLKLLKKLSAPLLSMRVKQDELLVIATRMGARSRFMTLDTFQGAIPDPLYHIQGAKDLSIYKLDVNLGKVSIPEGCEFLRSWQTDLNRDGENDILVESTCNKTHLLYSFYDQKLVSLYPSVKYKPTLTNINYEDFAIVPQNDGPPIFRFLNIGLETPTRDPWDNNISSKKNHLYELFPVKEAEGFKFNIRILENTKLWAKSLGLRYVPNVRVLHLIENNLLVMMGNQTAWVNLESQIAQWARLDDLLLLGSRRQNILGGKESVIQSFLTPYEYRGFVVNSGVKLRFIQHDRHDPFMDILGTQKTRDGYLSILRSFQHLIYLYYDKEGNILNQEMTLVDRFDFLTAQDLISTVINLAFDGKIIQVVDGTKVNTNYVDVIAEGKKASYEVNPQCATQQPVIVEGKLTLPLFCGKSKGEFEMQFIEL